MPYMLFTKFVTFGDGLFKLMFPNSSNGYDDLLALSAFGLNIRDQFGIRVPAERADGAGSTVKVTPPGLAGSISANANTMMSY